MYSGDAFPSKNKKGDESGNTQKNESGCEQYPFGRDLVKRE